MVETESKCDGSAVVRVVNIVLEFLLLLNEFGLKLCGFQAGGFRDILPESYDGVTATGDEDVVILADG